MPVMTDDDIDDVYLAREALETAAVRRIERGCFFKIMGWSAPAFKALDRVVREMRKAADAGNWQTVANRDLDLHSEAGLTAASTPSGTHVHHRDLRDPAVSRHAYQRL